jgi:hypothetical protein
LLATARQTGPVDQMRWGAVLARVSRLTGMPIEALHARFRPKRSAPKPAGPAAPPAEVASPLPEEPEVKIPRDRELAERQMLGILLKEPERWHKIGLTVHADDFQARTHRKLAETYWQHQQDLGEPVFHEFLSVLEDPAIKDLAVELMEFAEALDGVDETLKGALEFLDEEKKRKQAQKQLADLRRISQKSADLEDVEAKWAEFVKNNQTADPKRLGPVRRFKSGS